jgi:hypothetical protein
MTLADAEDLGATSRADGLSCWSAILQSYGLGIFHFSFSPALNTISLHPDSPSTPYLMIRIARLVLLVN